MPASAYLEAILLGIVQGIAEFLPISSSGHFVILKEPLESFLGTQSDGAGDLQLNIALHIGTLFSIFWVYRTDIWRVVKNPALCFYIALATVPIVIAGFCLKDWIESDLQTPLVAGAGLMVTAGLLVIGQQMERTDKEELLDQPTWFGAIVIGLFQAIALLPGISRSGSTIAGGLLAGMDRSAAARFSFLIAIPAISGAAVLMVKGLVTETGQGGADPAVLIVGGTTSFLVGLASLKWLLQVIARGRLYWFAWYCGIVGTLTVAWQIFN